jgi:hypothetical protein
VDSRSAVIPFFNDDRCFLKLSTKGKRCYGKEDIWILVLALEVICCRHLVNTLLCFNVAHCLSRDQEGV